MNNIKIAKQLIKLAKSLVAFDENNTKTSTFVDVYKIIDIIKDIYNKSTFKRESFNKHNEFRYSIYSYGYDIWNGDDNVNFGISVNFHDNRINLIGLHYQIFDYYPNVLDSYESELNKFKEMLPQKVEQIHEKYNDILRRYNVIKQDLIDCRQDRIFTDEKSLKQAITQLFYELGNVFTRFNNLDEGASQLLYDSINELENLQQKEYQIDRLTDEQDAQIQQERERFKGVGQVNLRQNYGKPSSYWRSRQREEKKKLPEMRRRQRRLYEQNQKEIDDFNDFDEE